MLFSTFKCPECGKLWGMSGKQHKCGYQIRVLGCPECMNIIFHVDDLLKNQNKYINKYGPIDRACSCSCGYVLLDMTSKEYESKYWRTFRVANNLPSVYSRFVRDLSKFSLDKYMYDNFFDHTKINTKHWNVIRFFAFLNPNLEESKRFFIEEYGEPYDELYKKTHNEKELETLGDLAVEERKRIEEWKESRKEALHPIPKCPVCGSTKLTRISTVSKAAKIYAFGIYGAGDIGKIYKCNNCGVKF